MSQPACNVLSHFGQAVRCHSLVNIPSLVMRNKQPTNPAITPQPETTQSSPSRNQTIGNGHACLLTFDFPDDHSTEPQIRDILQQNGFEFRTIESDPNNIRATIFHGKPDTDEFTNSVRPVANSSPGIGYTVEPVDGGFLTNATTRAGTRAAYDQILGEPRNGTGEGSQGQGPVDREGAELGGSDHNGNDSSPSPPKAVQGTAGSLQGEVEPKPQAEPDTAFKASPEETSARNAMAARDRAAVGLEEFPPAERKRFQTSLDSAESKGLERQANVSCPELLGDRSSSHPETSCR